MAWRAAIMTSNGNTADREIYLVRVFVSPSRQDRGTTEGGNLAPLVLDASGMTEAQMRALAAKYGHESAFLFPVAKPQRADGMENSSATELRFFVPEHEMEMCGHATVGVAWALHQLRQTTVEAELGKGPSPFKGGENKFLTKSGLVRTRCEITAEGINIPGRKELGDEVKVFVSQPHGIIESITDEILIAEILDVLKIEASHLAKDTPIQNACTSRVKTVIPLVSVALLNSLAPKFARVKDLCDKLGSTGLYPYAISADFQHVSSHGLSSSTVADVGIEARQFPRHSGYPEDAATGIAAAALSWALEKNGAAMLGQRVIVHQGRAMGEPSRIEVNLEPKGDGCWVGGVCSWADNEY
jgi:predicted PhzF superfamily epimerase YddE/YHI9